jgi:hypothetical protein
VGYSNKLLIWEISTERSACEYTMFAPVQLLHNWHEQWPCNQGDLYLSITGALRRVYYMGVDLLLISFLYCSMWLLLGCVLLGIFYIYIYIYIHPISYIGKKVETLFPLKNNQKSISLKKFLSLWVHFQNMPWVL